MCLLHVLNSELRISIIRFYWALFISKIISILETIQTTRSTGGILRSEERGGRRQRDVRARSSERLLHRTCPGHSAPFQAFSSAPANIVRYLSTSTRQEFTERGGWNVFVPVRSYVNAGHWSCAGVPPLPLTVATQLSDIEGLLYQLNGTRKLENTFSLVPSLYLLVTKSLSVGEAVETGWRSKEIGFNASSFRAKSAPARPAASQYLPPPFQHLCSNPWDKQNLAHESC